MPLAEFAIKIQQPKKQRARTLVPPVIISNFITTTCITPNKRTQKSLKGTYETVGAAAAAAAALQLQDGSCRRSHISSHHNDGGRGDGCGDGPGGLMVLSARLV